MSMRTHPVIGAVSLCLAHVPDLVRHGSKPRREIEKDEQLSARLAAARRSFDDAVAYAPNQVFVGNAAPAELWDYAEPWFSHPRSGASRWGPDGEIMPQSEFYCLMCACDQFDLVWLSEDFLARAVPTFHEHPHVTESDVARLGSGRPLREIEEKIRVGEAIALYDGDQAAGCVLHGHGEDESLDAGVLLENLAAKASGVLALRHALAAAPLDPAAVDYVLGSGEEAVGDRYQRGGGNLAKAIGEQGGCLQATGSDTKAFCCGPNHAIVIAASLVATGTFESVAVVGGGSLAKLGMKYAGHLKHEMPVIEDVLGSVAVLLGPDDGTSPAVDLSCVGRHRIGAGSSPQAIAEAIVVEPLERCGMGLCDVDRYATELHNPEVTLPQGSGDVPLTNYRMVASLAVRRGEIDRSQIDDFVRTRGMRGFAPTQGHVASAVPFLGHARRELMAGRSETAFFFAKGSLFLGRMTRLSDGLSFLLRRNGTG